MESRDSGVWVWVILGTALVFVVLALIVLMAGSVGRFYGMMTGGYWGWGILLMAISVLIPTLILLAILASLRESSRTSGSPSYLYPSALENLERRYARGELAREDYMRIRGDLTHGSSQR